MLLISILVIRIPHLIMTDIRNRIHTNHIRLFPQEYLSTKHYDLAIRVEHVGPFSRHAKENIDQICGCMETGSN
jgi:hypothetical protein